ncbi:hypothetical protein RI129_000653 [Pyrocoelia pectoralis]|uniref:4-coumarate--CoA ligase n=1 Tax=Pyrocoelia pectoralis TaxID=417401 RepID=A0AAN7VUV1_9COLE
MINLIRNFTKCKTLIQRSSFILKQKLHSLRTIEIPNMYVEECIWKNLDKLYDKTALVSAETNRSYTYLELYNKSNSLAFFLHKLGTNKDDTVAIILPNMPEYAITLLGTITAGLRVTAINPLIPPGEISKQIILTDTKLIFTTRKLDHVLRQTLKMSKLQIPIVTVKTQLLPNGAINFDDILEKQSPNFRFNLQRNMNDTVLILFSSGTTGYPKAVELTHKNIVSCLHQMSSKEFDTLCEANGFIIYQDVLPVVLPLFHVYGIMYKLLHGLLKGCKLITVQKFTTTMFINVLENYLPTVICLVPPIFHMLLNNNRVKESHFMKVRNIMTGAAPLGASHIEALWEKVGREVNIVQAYGLTECTSLSHIQTTCIKNGLKPGGIGLLIPSTEAKIRLQGIEKELSANQIGEILLRGPQIMKGYYKNENANKEAFTDDKWLITGDLGYYDDDGHFFITGRLKELIKVKSFQVAPAELEDLIRDHPDVDDIAVVGVPHSILGEAPKAFVVRKRDSNVTPRSIENYVKERVVNYKQLVGGVSFIDSIPRSPSGKILRNQLKEMS